MIGWAPSVTAAVAVSVVELDAASLGQFMISRPMVLGPVLGFAFGRPELGAAIGALAECLSLEQLPVGGNLPLNPTVAVAAGLLLAVGPSALPLEISVPAGFGAGWAHRRLESVLRLRRKNACAVAEEKTLSGEEPPLGRLAAQALAGQVATTLAVMLACLLALGPVLGWAWPRVPRAVQTGLGFGFSISPWLGAANLLKALGLRR